MKPDMLFDDEKEAKETRDREIAESVEEDLRGMNRTEILSYVNKIRANKSHAYNDVAHPNHDMCVRAMQIVYEKLYPDKKSDVIFTID